MGDFSSWLEEQRYYLSDANMPWLNNPLEAERIWRQMGKPAAQPVPAPVPKQAEAGEIARLRAEVAELRRQVAAAEAERRRDAQACSRNFEALLGEAKILDNVLGRIEKLEAHDPNLQLEYDDRRMLLRWVDPQGGEHGVSAQLPLWQHKDAYQAGQAYEVGDTVRHGGSLWLALESTTEKPGRDCPAWRLIVRAGRDGRDRLVKSEQPGVA